ncbi:hypothetical protein FQV27_17225 [Paracoccus aurantiacus]|uniref:Plasmid replication protein C N-terminal domain-containing protein n=1 Tax=Paracoccus aurantiacus TaxID=2599412 RepID=A0A5C6RSK4_9RHOB|nr:hypothetical protein FQV27_17225 [Paracoccus aurantiacus]
MTSSRACCSAALQINTSNLPNLSRVRLTASSQNPLRELSKAQAAFGVSERDLTVLQGLLSFFPDDGLGGNAEMVVFPSNKTICERLNGMPCSTMRRHLARLVEASLLQRRDSPNGKRYVRKHGEESVAFGFDLSPLYCQSEEIARAAEAVREAEERVRRLREVVSLMRRDLAALAAFGDEMQPSLGIWDQLHDKAILTARALRRKLSIEVLAAYRDDLEALRDQPRNIIDGSETEEMNTNDARSERHHHNSNKESIDHEPALEKSGAAPGVPDVHRDEPAADVDGTGHKTPAKDPAAPGDRGMSLAQDRLPRGNSSLAPAFRCGMPCATSDGD